MDKSFLYSLHKDVLVELICKSFDNISIKELGELYRNKCIDETDKYKEILTKTYRIEDLEVSFERGIIHFLTHNMHLKIDIADYMITDRNDKWSPYGNSQDLLKRIYTILSEKFEEENIAKIMNTKILYIL